MSITAALLLFLGLFATFSLILTLYGGSGTLYVVSLFLLLGLILKVRLRRRRDSAVDNLQQLPPELCMIPGIEQLRSALKQDGFHFHRSFIFDDIGRYAEIHAREGIFAEIIWDEDGSVPQLRFQSFFQNGITVTTMSGQLEEGDENPALQEQHLLPGRPLTEQFSAHRQRIDNLCRDGWSIDRPAAEHYSEPRS